MRYGFGRKLGLGFLAMALCLGGVSSRGDLWESLGLRKRGKELRSLSEDQIAGGLKEALEVGVRRAVETLGRSDGFLKDVQVRIPLPAGLKKAEAALRSLGQDQLADEFVTSMNRAAERAVPEAATVLADSVKQMTLEDARAILTSTNTAATDYFRRTSQSHLQARLLPIVKEATAGAGVTAKYKEVLDRSGLNRPGFLGNLGRSLLGGENLDLDEYVTRKTLDGLFLKIADEEVKIRENPSARTTEILQQVFGLGRK